jgi:RND family efflux transporter MFP subunit
MSIADTIATPLRGVLRPGWFSLLLLAALAACQREPPPEPVDQSIRPARIFRVTSGADIVRHQFVGRVEASQTVDVSFEVGGPLEQLEVREGQTVPRGSLIAALDSTDFALVVREAEVQLRLAGQDLTRKRRLLEDAGISRSIVDDAQALYELREVAVEKARENLADTRIVAPFNAYVARRFTDNHVIVRPGDPIVRLMDLNEIFVVANVPESLLATATADRVVGLQAEFAFIEGRQFELTYLENRGESSAVAQTFEVTFVMPRPSEWNILPGMTATVTVELKAPGPSQATIPVAALVAGREGEFHVWRYDPDTQEVHRTLVEIGAPVDGGVLISRGLKDGDLIVASGAAHLQPGMMVRMLGEPIVALTGL